MKCGCVFWEFAKRKLATRKDKDDKVECSVSTASFGRHQTVQQTFSANS
jgi:hypothetical protein